MAKYKIHKTKKGTYYIESEDEFGWGLQGNFKTKGEAQEEIRKEEIREYNRRLQKMFS